MAEDKRPFSSSSLRDDLHNKFIEPNTHAFIVKIWLESTREGEEPVIWRGYITHVASGQRQYLTNLNRINNFIAPYLYKLGVRPPFFERLLIRLGFTKD